MMDDSHLSDPEGRVLGADGAAPQHGGLAEGEWPSWDAADYEPSEPTGYPWDLLQTNSPPPSVQAPPSVHEDRDSALGSFDAPSFGRRSLEPEDIWYDPVREDPMPGFSSNAGDEAETQFAALDDEFDSQPAPKRTFEDARWAERAHQAKFQKVCKDLPRMPWEQGGWELIFEPSRNPLSQSLASRLQVSYGSEEACHLPTTNFASDLPEIPSAGVKARLRRFHLERPADDRREHAIKRLRALVMYDPETTFLGSVVAKEASNLADDEALSQSFTCAFAKSASGTLIKRAGSLDRYGKWVIHNRCISPLRCKEEDTFAYFVYLQSTGAGAMSGQHCVEALRFLHGMAVFQCLDLEVVLSSRVLGLVRIMHVSKAPLSQRPPLSVSHLSLLEQFVTMAKDHRACVVGQLVFCAHACVRWADSQRIKDIKIEADAESGVVLVLAGALGSKTAATAEARTRILPYVALGKGISNVFWAEAWLAAREAQGLPSGGAASVAAMAQALGEGRAIPQASDGPLAKEGIGRAEEELESDDSDHASVEFEAELEQAAEPAEREVFRGVPWTDCTVHVVSGITHVKRDNSSLLCGRFLSDNYKPFKPGSLLGDDPACCIQCFRALEARNSSN